VAARRSVWSDEKVRALAASFVPAADNVGRLQRGQDEESRLFQKLAEQGHYAGRSVPSDTRQGIYAAAPSGVLLASINSRSPGDVAGMLEHALQRWQELAPAQRLLAALPAPDPHRWEACYPEDGLVLRVVARDVERETSPADWRAAAWNQDYAWFTRDEASSLVPEPTSGARVAWPAALAVRLARLQLLDDVRGQVLPFRPKEVERAELESEVTALDDARIELAFHGHTRTSAKGKWPVSGFDDKASPGERERGFDAELLGRATFERGNGRFTRFELVAVGTRWGGTQFNGRGDDLDPAPMGVSLTLAGSTPAERVAPAQIEEYGWPRP